MIVKLKILSIDNYQYSLKDVSENSYILNLDFLDIEEKPRTGNYIYINEKLLNPRYEGYSTIYTFGNLENKYGKENIEIDDVDVIKIVSEKAEIYLKRLYG